MSGGPGISPPTLDGMPRPPGTWTEELDASLRQLVDEGLSRSQIAERMGLGRAPVMYRMRKLGLHSGLARTPAQKAALGVMLEQHQAVEAARLARARAYEAESHELAARHVAEFGRGLMRERARVETLIREGGPVNEQGTAMAIRLPSPVAEWRTLVAAQEAAGSVMRRHREEDRLTTDTYPGADRIVQLVELWRAHVGPYEPDAD